MAESGPPGPNQYQFDDLSIDTGKRLVLRDTSALEISGLTYDLLLAIVQAAPNIISADELVEKVWSGRPTSPETITQRAMMLRQGLGDSADAPRYIEVVRGQGFRLIPQVGSTKSLTKLDIPKPLLKGAAVIAMIIAAAWLGSEFNAQRAPSQDDAALVRRHTMELGELFEIGANGTGIQFELALSPDGGHLVYVMGVGSGENFTSKLFIRELNEVNAHPIEGTNGARHPFFSPDGQWIGFDTANGIYKISIRGGLKKTLTGGIRRMPGATWSDGGTIVFSTTVGTLNQTGRLLAVSEDGGLAEEILVSDGDLAFTWPHFLPGDKHLLVSSREINTPSIGGNIELLSLESGEYRTLITGAHNAKYSPTGHIVYARGDTVWAATFDLDALKITGSEAPLFDGVQHNSTQGDAVYDFSDDGLLVYMIGGEAGRIIAQKTAPVWVDREGNEVNIDLEAASYGDPNFSPDGSSAAIVINNDDSTWDIWTIDLLRETMSRLTFGPRGSSNPIWSPDGEQIIYRSFNDGGGVFSKAANGAGTATLINDNNVAAMPKGISPDGNLLLVMDQGGGISNLFVLSVEGESFPQPYITSAFDEQSGALSPDGRFVAYSTDESGRNQIEVRTFPNPDEGRWQISTDGGAYPKWSSDGSELFYRGDVTGSVYVVDIDTGPTVAVGEPRVLFSGDYDVRFGTYAVHPDGQRFMMFKDADVDADEIEHGARESQLVLVENWFEELKRITPTEALK